MTARRTWCGASASVGHCTSAARKLAMGGTTGLRSMLCLYSDRGDDGPRAHGAHGAPTSGFFHGTGPRHKIRGVAIGMHGPWYSGTTRGNLGTQWRVSAIVIITKGKGNGNKG